MGAMNWVTRTVRAAAVVMCYMLVRDLDQLELSPLGQWTTRAPSGVMP